MRGLPWLRSRHAVAGPPPTAALPAAPAPAPPAPAWTRLPPTASAIPSPVLTTDPEGFRGGLRSHRDPSFLAALGHEVTPEAPSGVVVEPGSRTSAVQRSALPQPVAPVEFPAVPGGRHGVDADTHAMPRPGVADPPQTAPAVPVAGTGLAALQRSSDGPASLGDGSVAQVAGSAGRSTASTDGGGHGEPTSPDVPTPGLLGAQRPVAPDGAPRPLLSPGPGNADLPVQRVPLQPVPVQRSSPADLGPATGADAGGRIGSVPPTAADAAPAPAPTSRHDVPAGTAPPSSPVFSVGGWRDSLPPVVDPGGDGQAGFGIEAVEAVEAVVAVVAVQAIERPSPTLAGPPVVPVVQTSAEPTRPTDGQGVVPSARGGEPVDPAEGPGAPAASWPATRHGVAAHRRGTPEPHVQRSADGPGADPAPAVEGPATPGAPAHDPAGSTPNGLPVTPTPPAAIQRTHEPRVRHEPHEPHEPQETPKTRETPEVGAHARPVRATVPRRPTPAGGSAASGFEWMTPSAHTASHTELPQSWSLQRALADPADPADRVDRVDPMPPVLPMPSVPSAAPAPSPVPVDRARPVDPGPAPPPAPVARSQPIGAPTVSVAHPAHPAHHGVPVQRSTADTGSLVQPPLRARRSPLLADPAPSGHPAGQAGFDGAASTSFASRPGEPPRAPGPRMVSLHDMFSGATQFATDPDPLDASPALQRATDPPDLPPPPEAAPTPDPEPSATPPTTATTAAAPTGPQAMTGPQLEELARRLYDPISTRLRAELWMDRERAGLVTDVGL